MAFGEVKDLNLKNDDLRYRILMIIAPLLMSVLTIYGYKDLIVPAATGIEDTNISKASIQVYRNHVDNYSKIYKQSIVSYCLTGGMINGYMRGSSYLYAILYGSLGLGIGYYIAVFIY